MNVSTRVSSYFQLFTFFISKQTTYLVVSFVHLTSVTQVTVLRSEVKMSRIMSLIRKEGEISCDSFLTIPLLFYKVLFIEMKPSSEAPSLKSKIMTTIKKANYVFVILNLALSIASSITNAVTKYGDGDIPRAMNCVRDALTPLLILVNLMTTTSRRKKMFEAYNELKVMVDARRNEKSVMEMKIYLKELERYLMIYTVTFVLAWLVYFVPAISFFTSGLMIYLTDFWFPFDSSRNEIFPFVMVWMDYVAIVSSLSLLAVDTMLYALLTVLIMELDDLKSCLADLKSSTRQERAKTIESLISRHQMLSAISEKLQSIYDLDFLFTLVSVSMILCLSILHITKAPTSGTGTAKITFNIFYIMVVTSKTWLLCYFGQKLIDSSIGVADGVYDSGWEELDGADREKYLTLIMMASHKPKQLKAKGLAIISLETFASVISHQIIFN